MVLFMDGVTRLLAGTLTLYAPVRCHTVRSVVTEEDRRVYNTLYRGTLRRR